MSNDRLAVNEERFRPGDVRRSLSQLMPQLGPYWDRSLRDYAAAVYQIEQFRSDNPARNHAMALLLNRIEAAARKSGFSDDDARNASLELVASPVLQTGPHCLLLFEPDAFYTHLFSLLGLMAQNRKWHISYFVSTSAFKERAKKGPGWLRLEGEPLNLFGLPRRRMDGGSIGCLNGPYRFTLSNSAGKSAPNAASARLLAELPPDAFASAADAIKAGNSALWRHRFPTSVKLLQLDDFDVADLVANHIEDSKSWMALYFIGDGEVPSSMLKAIDHLNAGPWAGWIRRTTDLFWRVEEDRIVPLRLEQGILRTNGSSSCEVKWSPASIALALRQREIIPNLLTAFLVLSILPGVRALGGYRQTVYLPLMRYLASVGIERSGDVGLLKTLSEDRRPALWGHRALAPAEGDPFAELAHAGNVPTLLAEYGEMTLMRASGELAGVTRDSVWGRLDQHIAEGLITAASNELRWSGL
jgi:hypothetical protein